MLSNQSEHLITQRVYYPIDKEVSYVMLNYSAYKGIVLFKKGALLFFITVMLFTSLVYAEGSRELTANGGNRPYLEFSNDDTIAIKNQGILKVYVNAGEQVNLGSSVTDFDVASYTNPTKPSNATLADIVYRSPSGIQNGTCDVNNPAGVGFIDTIDKEKAGPLPKIGGYTPCSFIAAEKGVYEVEFHAPNYGGPNQFPKTMANQLFSTKTAITTVESTSTAPNGSQGRGVAAWDITVFKKPDDASTEQTGRVYANYLSLNVGYPNAGLYSKTYVLSKTGYLYRIDLNGSDPWQFIFFANNRGFKKSNTPSFKSVKISGSKLETGITLQKPGDVDTAEDVTYKMFLNPPAGDLPADADSPTGKTWMLTPQPTPPTVDNFKFEGKEDNTVGKAGTSPLGGTFSFDAGKIGNYILTIDANKNSIYGDENDTVLTGQVAPGTNKVAWNGKDGLDGSGNALAPQEAAYGVKLSIIVDDVHFPFLDVENNPKGIIVEQIDRTTLTLVNSTVYYNNQGLEAIGQTVPISATAGIDSKNGSQAFTKSWGDNKGVDTWTSILNPIDLVGGIVIRQADLSVNKTVTFTDSCKGTVTYTITVHNDGPNEAVGVKVEDDFPNEITGVTWSCTPDPTVGNACAASTGTSDLNTTVDLKNGGSAVFKVTGNIDLAPNQVVNNTATITRPLDLTNPPKGAATGDAKTETSEPETSITCDVNNKPPVADDKTAATACNTSVNIVPGLSATDPDGKVASYTIVTLPLSTEDTLYFGNPNDGKSIASGHVLSPDEVDKIFFQPTPTFSGTASFTYTATDDKGATSAPATVTITVTPCVTPPPALKLTADPISTTIPVGSAVDLSPLNNVKVPPGSTLDLNKLKVTIQPTNGTVKINSDGTFTYTPNPGFTGTDTFEYEVCTTDGDCVKATATITVTPSTSPPVESRKLTVTVKGGGSGNVSSTPGDIQCNKEGGRCLATYDTAVAVTLTPTAALGSKFDHWEGDCLENNGVVVMAADKACTAYFELPPLTTTTLTTAVTGNGKITSEPASIECSNTGGKCTDSGVVDRKIMLVATPDTGWHFEGWQGHCDDKGQVTMDTDKQCQALFVPETAPRLVLTADKVGEGSVTSQPSGIDCGTDCVNNYAKDTVVELTATAKPGYSFIGWSGDCSGTSNVITVAMDAAKKCIASFVPLPEGTYALTVVNKSGHGKVTSREPAINCGQDCSENFARDTKVELTALPEPGYSFVGWSGDCAGTDNPIIVTITAAKTCEANFAPADDHDGVSPDIEKAAPNNGDGNSDHIPDVEQNNVVSLPGIDGRYVTIEVNKECIVNNIQLSKQTPPADECAHPSLFDFNLTCAAAKVTLYYHGFSQLDSTAVSPIQELRGLDVKSHRQYVPTTPGDIDTNQWQDLPTEQGAVTIDGHTVSTATFSLTDGKLGDISGVDGQINNTSGRTACSGKVQWTSANSTVNEFGNVATVTVSRVGGSSGRITVDYSAQDGTATQGDDYTSVHGTLVWEDGDTGNKTFAIPIKNDIDPETNETINLSLSNPTGGATINAPDAAVLTIIDDETVQPPASQVTNGTCCSTGCCSPTCSSCQSGNAGMQVKALATMIHVGQTLSIIVTEGKGELAIKEIPDPALVSLDNWKPLGNGVAQVTLTGASVGQTRMTIGDSGNALQTTLLDITVTAAENVNFGIQAISTTLHVGQSLSFIVAGGQGKLFIDQIPDSAFVSLDEWTPLGDTGTGEVTLKGVSKGSTQLVLSDSSKPPQKTTVNIKVLPRGLTSVTGDSTTGTGSVIDGTGSIINGTGSIIDGTGTIGNTGDSGDGMENGCDANALGINALGQAVQTQACFASKISTPQGQRPNHTMFTQEEAQNLDTSAYVMVDPEHIGQPADILILRVHTTLTDEERQIYDDQNWVYWDDQIASLASSLHVQELPDVVEIPIEEGNLSNLAGELHYFVGYRLSNGTIIHNGLGPVHFFIGNASSINLREDTLKTLNSTDVRTTSFFEPFVYSYEGERGEYFEMSDTLSTSVYLRVDNWHVGRAADILVVANRRGASGEATYAYSGQEWQLWNGQLEQLPVAQRFHQLPATLEIPVNLKPLLMPGEFTVFVGYRLDNYIIVFNGTTPMHFVLAE